SENDDLFKVNIEKVNETDNNNNKETFDPNFHSNEHIKTSF
ncbi:unnamed protein product, partial [Rotaria sp. Silwood2]